MSILKLKKQRILSLCLLLFLSGTACSTLKTIKPRIIDFKGARYWLVLDQDVINFCVQEKFTISPKRFETNSTKEISAEECYALLEQHSIIYTVDDHADLEVYIKTVVDQYKAL